MKNSLFLIVMFFILSLSKCSVSQIHGNEQLDSASEAPFVPIETEKLENDTRATVEIQENRHNEFVFSISLDKFVNEYNGFFYADNGQNFFPSKTQWQTIRYDSGIHSDYKAECRTFTEDPNIHVLPTISIYTPSDDDRILEVSINFDWHSYTEGLYESYEQMCFYALKVFFPDLSDEQIHSIYKELNALANQNMYPSDQWYGPGAIPCALYHKDSIGIYSYFAVGDWMYFCIIPVSTNQMDDFRLKGVPIYEIK